MLDIKNGEATPPLILNFVTTVMQAGGHSTP